MQLRKFFIQFSIFILFILLVNFIYHYQSYGKPKIVTMSKVSSVKYSSKGDRFSNLINAVPFTCDSSVSVVIIVLCETRNIHQRNVIRRTWGQWLSKKYAKDVKSPIIPINYHSNQTKLLFVMGSKTTEKNDVQNEIEFLKNELHYNDVIYFPGLLDTYLNLTLKTLTGLNTARNACSNATFFLKADTDIFLNVPRLLDLCQQHTYQSDVTPLIVGNEQFNAPVVREKNSKWYVSPDVYPNAYFPNYVSGCGYLLNAKAIDNIISTVSQVKNLFFWEDVAVTGMYSKNVILIDNKLFRYEEYMKSIDSCYMRLIIVAHRINPEKMVSIWNEIVSNKTDCSSLPNIASSLKKFEYLIKSMIYG